MGIYGVSGGVPLLDFSEIGNLGKTYKDAQNERTLANLGKGLADGSLDYKQAAGMAAGAGKLDIALSLIKMGEQKKSEDDFTKGFGGLLGVGNGAAPQPVQAPQPARPLSELGKPQTVDPNQVNSIDAMADLKPGTAQMLPRAQSAIAGIESGGDYQKLGPVTRTGDRALGKYQVMAANVPAWTKEVLGREMSPQEFLSNPDAQDAVFNAKFGGSSERFGPQGAAKAWFAGEGGMNDPGRRDQLGTSVQGYADRFASGMGQAPVQLAMAGNGMPQSAPQPAPMQVAQNAPTPRTNPVQNNIPALMYVMAHPGASAGQKKAAEIALTEAIKSPDNLKEYDFYQKQSLANGQQPLPLLDWTIKIKQAGATAITNDMKGENAYSQTMGKEMAGMNIDIPKAAIQARGKIATMDRLTQLMADPSIYTGAGGEKVLELKRLGKAIGVDVGDVGPAEAVRAISNQFALEMRNPAGGAGMPGAMSDKDREFLQAIVPGLQNNPQGNALVLDYMKRIAKRSIDVEAQRRAYVKKNGKLDEGFFGALSDFSDENPVFPEANQAAQVPQQQQQPQAAPQIQDGMTATNPKTGQKIMFKNGQWAPAQSL